MIDNIPTAEMFHQFIWLFRPVAVCSKTKDLGKWQIITRAIIILIAVVNFTNSNDIKLWISNYANIILRDVSVDQFLISFNEFKFRAWMSNNILNKTGDAVTYLGPSSAQESHRQRLHYWKPRMDRYTRHWSKQHNIMTIFFVIVDIVQWIAITI